MGNFYNELKEYQNIPRKLIFDNSISDRARFVFCFMATKPDDWNFYLTPMAKEIGYSVDTLRKYINELVERGWLVKGEQERLKGNLFGAVSYTLKANIDTQESSDTEKVRHRENTTQHNIDNNIKENNNKEDIDKSISKKSETIDYAMLKSKWEETNPNLSSIREVSEKRKRSIRTLLKNNNAKVEDLITAFKIVSVCSFLQGKNNHSWQASFDWLINDTKSCFNRILEGEYCQGKDEMKQYTAIVNGSDLKDVSNKESNNNSKWQY